MLSQITPEERDQMKRWVDTWKRAGPELDLVEQQRWFSKLAARQKLRDGEAAPESGPQKT